MVLRTWWVMGQVQADDSVERTLGGLTRWIVNNATTKFELPKKSK